MGEAQGLAGRVQSEVPGLGVVGSRQIPHGGLSGWDHRAGLPPVCLSEEGLGLVVQWQVAVVAWNHRGRGYEGHKPGDTLTGSLPTLTRLRGLPLCNKPLPYVSPVCVCDFFFQCKGDSIPR